MGARYYMGTRKGKAKSTGNDYWALMIFRKNRFGSYEVSQYFIDESVYNHINSKGLALGTAVSLEGDIVEGQVEDISIDSSFVSLNLEQRPSSNPVQYATNMKKGG